MNQNFKYVVDDTKAFAEKDSTSKQMIDNIKIFLKTAWCIDGDVTFEGFVDVVIKNKIIESGIFKLTDSNRGEFYVTTGTKKRK